MDVKVSLNVVEIILALIVLALILTQSRGSAFSGSFNSDNSSTYRSRRGLEAFVFRLTIAMSTIFLLVSLIAAIVERSV